MAHFSFKSVATFILMQCAAPGFINASTCSKQSDSSKTLTLLINSRKGGDGEWVTTFQASRYGSQATNITLDLTQSVRNCSGDEAVHVKGMIRANNVRDPDRLTFHPKCGKNAAISHDGRSVQKMNLDDPLNGVVLTHRPLRRNELFEVRLDKKNNKFNWCMGIGVTNYTPESFTIPDHMFNLKSGNWMLYHAVSHVDGAVVMENYGRNLNELQVGDRVGVMVNNFGSLHYFVNGVDQGPAASNLPLTVHGVFELYFNAAKGTIVDSSP